MTPALAVHLGNWVGLGVALLLLGFLVASLLVPERF